MQPLFSVHYCLCFEQHIYLVAWLNLQHVFGKLCMCYQFACAVSSWHVLNSCLLQKNKQTKNPTHTFINLQLYCMLRTPLGTIPRHWNPFSSLLPANWNWTLRYEPSQWTWCRCAKVWAGRPSRWWISTWSLRRRRWNICVVIQKHGAVGDCAAEILSKASLFHKFSASLTKDTI